MSTDTRLFVKQKSVIEKAYGQVGRIIMFT